MKVTIRFPLEPAVLGAGTTVVGTVVETRNTTEYQHRFEWEHEGRVLSRMVDQSWIVADVCERCGGRRAGCRTCFGTGLRVSATKK